LYLGRFYLTLFAAGRAIRFGRNGLCTGQRIEMGIRS
jgi:hypothetical protein